MQRKALLLSALIGASLMSGVSYAKGTGFDQNNAVITVGMASQESQTGYFVSGAWQINDYVEFGLGVNSYLNNDRFEASDFLPADFDLSEYEDTEFRPRHNDIQFGVTFRHPLNITDHITVSPYLEIGSSRLSTKKIKLTTSGSATSTTTSNTASTKIISFDDISSFHLGSGLQVTFGQEHEVRFGVRGYTTDDDWEALTIEEEQRTAYLRYEYRPYKSPFGFVFGAQNADQFGDPSYRIGVSWAFN